ncbi:peptidoglycan-binding domain-containing protein [Pseudanabaena yagii]|uniref:Peptidoglycan-binding protein n=1 Tax=Pseudanabaena yagii GIHE-NHR1 TaxID=2722753 RepID=A0ABX1LLH9_9CYAN|nr:peptidoglycan-binding protein [Pseudanabaena yagii]NMF56928.1 peptidoglycan-binding protein [Pseudanabaena yagii GIHE-NHR1]
MDATLRQGSKGNAVVELQQLLQAKGFYTGKIDGDFGAGTANAVLKFQKANGLTADGIVGNASWSKLREASPSPSNPQTTPSTQALPTLLPGSQGQAVAQAQQLLKAKGYYQGRIDGDFGVGTRDAIAAFQRANGLTVDGKVGAQTWQKLQAPAIADVTSQPSVTPPTDVVIVRPPVATPTPTPTPSVTPTPTPPSSVFVPAPTGTTSTDTTPVTSIPPASAISLVDAANSYSRARLPNQTVALNNLQANISPEILQQFLQRWQIASGQANTAPSLQDALSTYNSSQMLNQNLALQWLQNQLLPQTLDQFRQDWSNLNVAVGISTGTPFTPSQPAPTTTPPTLQLINLTDAVKVYKRTPSQVTALENLQSSVPDLTLQQFFQRWSTASDQSAIAISLLDVFQDYNSQQFPSQVTALQWLEKELTSAQLAQFSRDWQA